MTDEQRDENAPASSSEMDDLIAAAAEQADETPPADPAEDGPEVRAPDADDPTRADDPTGAPTEEPTDWETLAELDDRSRGQLLAELTAASDDRDGYLDALRRKQAEFDNFRKRTQRDAAGMRVAGQADVAARLLDVLDDFDRTLDNAGEVEETFLKGVTLVHDKLFAALGDVGLRRIDEADVTFDPNRHEAVQQVPADESLDEPVVSEVYRPGYELDGRVLRAAMVVVKQ